MPYTIEKKQLYNILQKAYPIVPAKSSLQILSNIKLVLSPDTIEVTATDLDHSIKVREFIKGDGEVELAVNARKFFEIVRELSEGECTLSFDENVMIIESGDSFVCKISGTDTQDFPMFPETGDDTTEITLPLSHFNTMIQKSSFAVSKDETRACLCGVLWEIEKKKTGMIATDGHRLGSCFYSGDFNTAEKIKKIVSPKTLLHIGKIVSQDEKQKEIKVKIGDKYILFSVDNITMCSKLIEGLYPDYEKVIPKSSPKKPVINRGIFQEAVRRVSVLSNQKTHLVKFIFKKDELEIIVLNRDIGGEARQTIPVSYDGEELIIGFNASYLYEILNIISSQKIRMEMSTQISACLIFSEEEKGESEDLYLIMPLRIMEEA